MMASSLFMVFFLGAHFTTALSTLTSMHLQAISDLEQKTLNLNLFPLNYEGELIVADFFWILKACPFRFVMQSPDLLSCDIYLSRAFSKRAQFDEWKLLYKKRNILLFIKDLFFTGWVYANVIIHLSVGEKPRIFTSTSVNNCSLAYTQPVNSVLRALWLVPQLGIS